MSEAGDWIVKPDLGAALRIQAEDGRTLLTIERDGTVTGSVEDASEAGRVFVQATREWLEVDTQKAIRAAKAGAWAEGHKQGGPMHDENHDDPDAHNRNPYRKEQTNERAPRLV